MVLESLVNPIKAEAKPYEMFFVGLLYSSIAIFLGIWIFKEHASLVMVFLTVLASTPLMYNTLKLEERKDLKISNERKLLREHGRALSFFMFLFIGFVIAFSIWYIFLPSSIVESAFLIQTQTIEAINARLSGGSINIAHTFSQIFFNNLKVLLFSIFFSFFYGAGAIFILTWNASVISTAIGNFIRSNLASIKGFGITQAWSYFHIFSLGLLKYFTHGIPEILSYFVAGLSGGIISVAIIKHDFSGEKFRRVFSDALDLLVIAVFLLFIAALIEVFITPLLF